ncbi:hypothetical protein [Bacillus sp. OK048]|uniref:hypothetical protein n=1 Tax=Bacillus sp. OK048 TaxID=1882761 RepID=UPI0008899307|nr:hypothetical protein [Bacillus sp. OK048]SDN23067.1 hypothetical protein SAMN05443253_109117 [Bacillus sp. OK048]
MKRIGEMNQLDNHFKSMNHKMNMTEQEQKEVLLQIQNKMNSRKQQSKQPWKYYFTLASVAFILMLLAMPLLDSIQNKSEGSKVSLNTDEKNLRTIGAVLQNALTGPNDELDQKIESEGLEYLVKYEEDLYREYFANDTAYLGFVNRFASTLMIAPRRNGYQLKVKNIEYEKIDAKDMVYNFTVELQYQKEGSGKSDVEQVKGQANLNEEHKIEDIIISFKGVPWEIE